MTRVDFLIQRVWILRSVCAAWLQHFYYQHVNTCMESVIRYPVWAQEHCRISLVLYPGRVSHEATDWTWVVLFWLYFALFAFWVHLCIQFIFICSIWIFCTVHILLIFLYCRVCQYQSCDLLWSWPPKWPRLCRVWLKLHTNSLMSLFCVWLNSPVLILVSSLTVQAHFT